MTTFHLFLWLLGGLLLQVALFLIIGFWRHWLNYLSLQGTLQESTNSSSPQKSNVEAPSQLAAWKGLRSFRVERKVLEDAAEQVCSFYLSPKDGQLLPLFLPGQFLTFQLAIEGCSYADKPLTRCYSLSDSPNAEYFRISVKRIASPQPTSVAAGISSNYLHDYVKVGSELQVFAPAGQFFINTDNSPVVLVGGGIGITPMISMLNWVFEHQPQRETWLFYGVRNATELVFQEKLIELAKQHPSFHLHLCMSDPHAIEPEAIKHTNLHLHHVRADIQLLRRVLPLKPFSFYICGPSAMLQSLVPALEDWGVPSERIHFEAFGPASVTRSKKITLAASASELGNPTETHDVKFSRSNQLAKWTPTKGSLLDFAEEQGIAVNSNCRSGVCGTCQSKLRKGKVNYTTEPVFEIEAGSCLLCISSPATDISLEI
jgi:ferredoxin-NADP reductase